MQLNHTEAQLVILSSEILDLETLNPVCKFPLIPLSKYSLGTE